VVCLFGSLRDVRYPAQPSTAWWQRRESAARRRRGARPHAAHPEGQSNAKTAHPSRCI